MNYFCPPMVGSGGKSAATPDLGSWLAFLLVAEGSQPKLPSQSLRRLTLHVSIPPRVRRGSERHNDAATLLRSSSPTSFTVGVWSKRPTSATLRLGRGKDLHAVPKSIATASRAWQGLWEGCHATLIPNGRGSDESAGGGSVPAPANAYNN